jgi:hypothetical protein
MWLIDTVSITEVMQFRIKWESEDLEGDCFDLFARHYSSIRIEISIITTTTYVQRLGSPTGSEFQLHLYLGLSFVFFLLVSNSL